MAFGVKTNERPGVRAQVRYVRVSPYKARQVLDLIRGEQVARALEILEFAERDVARVILKCLESAVANAEHNNGIPADELYVSACYADEGPTLKRWRPRARGRATRIRKRTSHITIIVSRLSPDELERLRAREAVSGTARGNRAAAEARRQRVLRSRQAKAERRAAGEQDHDDHEHGDDAHEHGETAPPQPDNAGSEPADERGAAESGPATEPGPSPVEAADTDATSEGDATPKGDEGEDA